MSQNRSVHGLCYHNNLFFLLDDEDKNRFDELLDQLIEEHQPATFTEQIIVRNMGHHEWLRCRAMRLQNGCLHAPPLADPDTVNREFALYLRYQTQHERRSRNGRLISSNIIRASTTTPPVRSPA